MTATLAFGQAPDQRLISIDDALRGLACGCVCPACQCRLIAKKGDEVAHHFAHEADAECEGARESMLHKLAKQVLASHQQVWLPDLVARLNGETRFLHSAGLFKGTETKTEVRRDYIQPDVLIASASGRMLAVEVAVTHPVSDEKARKFAEQGLPCIEIDLSALHNPALTPTPDELIRAILLKAPRKWVFSATIVAAEAEMRTEQARREADAEARRAARQAAKTEAERAAEAVAQAAYERMTAEANERWRVNEARRQIEVGAWEARRQEVERLQAERRAAVEAYKAAERAEAEYWTKNDPYQWRFAVDRLARKFLIQNDAEAWMTRPLLTRPEYTLDTWTFNDLPDAATIDAVYEELWAEIIRERRWRGPKL